MQHVEAYLEYRRVVGDDDGGKLFTPEEYEAYKKTHAGSERAAARLFVTWCPRDLSAECKAIGPETPCFCGHRYKAHKTEFKLEELSSEIPKLPCRERGCGCDAFTFVPALGGMQHVRCRCKHTTEDHNHQCGNTACTRQGCKCKKFSSGYRCPNCGCEARDHVTHVETRTQREARGLPTGPSPESSSVHYRALGGLTSHSSLLPDSQRADLRALGGGPPSLEGTPASEEEVMAEYERRYQARLKAEKAASRRGIRR
eukprot:m.208338 g.208338  ORF g.208338 m.208338 type:complete len:257 (+) comp15808_c0_seq2:3011-3781(+)